MVCTVDWGWGLSGGEACAPAPRLAASKTALIKEMEDDKLLEFNNQEFTPKGLDAPGFISLQDFRKDSQNETIRKPD